MVYPVADDPPKARVMPKGMMARIAKRRQAREDLRSHKLSITKTIARLPAFVRAPIVVPPKVGGLPDGTTQG